MPTPTHPDTLHPFPYPSPRLLVHCHSDWQLSFSETQAGLANFPAKQNLKLNSLFPLEMS